jgi:hypothetical protein
VRERRCVALHRLDRAHSPRQRPTLAWPTSGSWGRWGPAPRKYGHIWRTAVSGARIQNEPRYRVESPCATWHLSCRDPPPREEVEWAFVDRVGRFRASGAITELFVTGNCHGRGDHERSLHHRAVRHWSILLTRRTMIRGCKEIRQVTDTERQTLPTLSATGARSCGSGVR